MTADDAKGSSSDPNAIRTLIVTGLPNGLTKAVLWKKIRKVNPKAELEYPVEGAPDTGESLCSTLIPQQYPPATVYIWTSSAIAGILIKKVYSRCLRRIFVLPSTIPPMACDADNKRTSSSRPTAKR